jgi:Anti-sigma factor NepR
LFPPTELFSSGGFTLAGWHLRHRISATARISVTNLHTSPKLNGPDPKQVLAERQAMAKANKPDNHDDVIGGDPIAAALKQMHDAVTSEELPDDFLRLLDEIDTKIAAKKTAH